MPYAACKAEEGHIRPTECRQRRPAVTHTTAQAQHVNHKHAWERHAEEAVVLRVALSQKMGEGIIVIRWRVGIAQYNMQPDPFCKKLTWVEETALSQI